MTAKQRGVGKIVPKIFIHAGPQKTASTYIQSNLHHNREALKDQNWKLVFLKRERPDVVKGIERLRRGLPEKRHLFKRFLRTLATDSDNTFVTFEGILGTNNFPNSKGVLFPFHRKMLKKMKRWTQGADVSVGFCLRDYASWLLSNYSQLMVAGRTWPIEEYLQSIKLERLSWLPIVEAMVKVFGESNVRVWTFEDFKMSPERTFAAVAGASGMEAGKIAIQKSKPMNRSIPVHTLHMAVGWNQLLQSCAIPRKDRVQLRRNMRKLLAQSGDISPKPDIMPDGLRAQLVERYDADVALLKSKWPSIFLSVPNETAPQRLAFEMEPAIAEMQRS
jgi:hypothetical protein